MTPHHSYMLCDSPWSAVARTGGHQEALSSRPGSVSGVAIQEQRGWDDKGQSSLVVHFSERGCFAGCNTCLMGKNKCFRFLFLEESWTLRVSFILLRPEILVLSPCLLPPFWMFFHFGILPAKQKWAQRLLMGIYLTLHAEVLSLIDLLWGPSPQPQLGKQGGVAFIILNGCRGRGALVWS